MRAGEMDVGGLGMRIPVDGSTMGIALRERAAAAAAAAAALEFFIGEMGEKYEVTEGPYAADGLGAGW